MKLIISEVLVLAIAYKTSNTEVVIYKALMEKIKSLQPKKSDVERKEIIRRQFTFSGTLIPIVIQYRPNSITIIPAANKKLMSLDHTNFIKELEEGTDTWEDIESKLLSLNTEELPADEIKAKPRKTIKKGDNHLVDALIEQRDFYKKLLLLN